MHNSETFRERYRNSVERDINDETSSTTTSSTTTTASTTKPSVEHPLGEVGEEINEELANSNFLLEPQVANLAYKTQLRYSSGRSLLSMPAHNGVDLWHPVEESSLGDKVLHEVSEAAGLTPEYIAAQEKLMHRGVGNAQVFDETVAKAATAGLETGTSELSNIQQLIEDAKKNLDFRRARLLLRLRDQMAQRLQSQLSPDKKRNFVLNAQDVLRKGVVDEHFVYARDSLSDDPIVRSELDEIRELAVEITHPHYARLRKSLVGRKLAPTN